MAWRIGVDIGGTFTDVALVDDATGEIGVAKAPTTPQDFAAGVLSALAQAMERYGVKATEVGLLAHATTVVTNALLGRKRCPCRRHHDAWVQGCAGTPPLRPARLI